MHLRYLSKTDLILAIDMAGAIDAVGDAFASLSGGEAEVPLRTPIETQDGVSLFMPAMVRWPGAGDEPPTLGAKVVSVFPGNAARGLPAIMALVLLIDSTTGAPVAMMEGSWLTALRTGAGSGLATRWLANPDAKTLAVFGAGPQARTQIEAVRCVREIDEVRIVSRTAASAERLASELIDVRVSVTTPELALEGADVVVAATDSQTPVFDGRWVEAGTHVNAVGAFTPEMQEVDETLIVRAHVFVDEREAAWAEAGDLIIPRDKGLITEDHVLAEIGEVVLGRHAGRTDSADVTFYKSVGNAVQDLAVARHALRRAEELGLGQLLPLD